MSSDRLSGMTQAQRDRLAFVELRLRFVGEIRRQDLVTRFDIQAAAATRDIAQYKEMAPGNMEYDPKGKVYVRASWFRALFDFPAERVLTWLSQGYGDGEPIRWKGVVAQEGTSLPGKIDLELLSVLTRAIHQGAAVEIAYRALSSGLTTREIVPFALADSGLRWHVRAFDRRSGEFRDFVLGRLDDAQLLSGPVADHEKSDQDIQWNRITELELVPHPANVQHPDTIEAEYGMEGGVLKFRARAAMAGYLLRRWNVDCTDDHSLKGGEYHLWLRNRQALYGVTNLVLAPGYGEPSKEW
ncbi:WYL domain-containing protein [Pandoraea nosoerga]|nr:MULTISPECIES: WYL domain-containing protein [Burkholderiaceae]MBN4666590.1 WYL domain-containing protein [Pandoraea nosoerga]MBN4674166.1 WYL domain-containing protein [Pandoraea nosoerga]MBN4679900.1 WYL domain-containing protein [Pandoraea nosoerga]MBN4744385.1 WYL domain-containing protein [Pandoraea nosoerga]MBU9223740.1 WYL domain-containing protein [Burkholderia multivorans]